MPCKKIKLAVSQSYTLSSLAATLDDLEATCKTAAAKGIDLILFPEAYLGGYPRTCTFGAAVGARTDEGREQFLQYFQAAVDVGDTPAGAGDDWIDRKLPIAKGQKYRGDGTRERLEAIARDTGVFLVTGLVERSGGSLYCAVLYVDPVHGCLGKRRKVMPTGSERLVWAQGSPSTLRAVVTHIKGVRITMAAAICWENYMPLLRYSLYSQNVNLYLAPTADFRATWLPLMQTIGAEGRAFVLSANQCQRRSHLPDWIAGTSQEKEEDAASETNNISDSTPTSARPRRTSVVVRSGTHELVLPAASSRPNKMVQPQDEFDTFVSRGGSCIVGPMGQVLAGPLWEVEKGGLLIVDADFEDSERGRLDLDVAGSYSRNDAFHLKVDGLDISPPP